VPAKALCEFAQIERLHQIIDAADLGSDLAVFRSIPSGAENDGEERQVWDTLERTAQIESRTIGQIHIQQDEVGRRGAGESECRRPVGSGPSFVAEALEDVAEHLAHLGFVFNNQDSFVHLHDLCFVPNSFPASKHGADAGRS